jgi:hypothetical protein
VLALTSPTSGSHSVGIVRWRTKAPEFVCFVIIIIIIIIIIRVFVSIIDYCSYIKLNADDCSNIKQLLNKLLWTE